MANIVDLDTLLPAEVTIKIEGQEIKVKPPTTQNILRIGQLGKKLSEMDAADEGDVIGVVNELTVEIGKCIPELAGKNFNTPHLFMLIKILSDMATPPDVKELAKRNITPGDSDPKAK